MNVSPRNLKQTGNKHQKHQASRLVAKTKTVVLVLLLLSAAFIIINYRVALNEQVNRLERERILGEEVLKNLELEIKNLQVKRAELRRWKHIRAKLAQFKLDLQLPMPGQVVALQVIGDKPSPTENIASRKIKTPTVALR